MKQLSNWLFGVASTKVTLLSLFIFLVFVIVVLPSQSEASERITGDAGSPDMSFIYTAEDLYTMAESYGEEGRNAYIMARFTFDLVWPLIYTIFLCASISWVFQRVFAPGNWLRRMNLLPLFGALADYLENIATSVVMFRYPTRTPLIDILAPYLTLIKWILISAGFLFLLAGFVIAMWNLIAKRAAD